MEALILLIDEHRPTFTVDDIVVFFLPFTNLRSLTPEYADFVTAKILALQFFPHFPRLRSLKSWNNGRILLFLGVLPDATGKDLLPCLEHLGVGELNPRELGRVPRLLNRMSGWLHPLTVQFDYYKRSGDSCACLPCSPRVQAIPHTTQIKASSSPRSYTSSTSLSSSRTRGRPCIQLWNHVLRTVIALRNPPIPPLERITLKFVEDGTIRHPNGRKLPLDCSRMREVEELLLLL